MAAAREAFPPLKYYHLAATAGSAYADQIDGNVMRIGLGLYGFNILPRRPLDLKPALEVRSRDRAIQLGFVVGYDLDKLPRRWLGGGQVRVT